MDFKSMTRRELQALCKKHGLPANSTNSQMALSLASFLQNNEKIKLRGCLKGSDESGRENSGPKKVSFSLEDEEFEFEKSLGIPEKRRSTRRASVGAIKADDLKARVPEVPARITRSRALEVFHLTDFQEDEDVQCDGRKKRKESCVVEPNLRTLRNRVVIVPGNECELPGNQKLRRGSRRDAGKPKEIPRVDAFQNMKLGEGEAFEKKISRKRSRVADVGEAFPCNTNYGYTIPERTEVDAGADVTVPQCGEPPPRRLKHVLLNTETVVFDVGATKKVEALPKRSTRSNVVESEISTVAGEKSGVESDIVGGNKQMKRTSNRAIKSKAPAVSESASEFITEGTATEACGQPEELPKFRVPSRRMTRSSSKQVARELVTLLPASEKLVNGKETARATSSRKKHGNRKSSENLCLSGETVSVSKALEVQVAHFEEVPLHPMQNTREIGVKECEATDGLKQIDDVARGQDSIASPRIYAESEALAVANQKVVARRATHNSTKNEALLTSAMQNLVPKEKVVARRLTRHSTKKEALLASAPQNVLVGVGKKGSTVKRARKAVPDEDATYVERDISGGFSVTRNQENGITVDGNDKKPGSHVANTRGSKSCRRVNSIAETPQGENSPDPPLSLLEDSRQDIFIGEGSACKVRSKSQLSQRLQSIGKMSFDEQKNSENIHKRSGDDKLVDEHKCMEEGCSTHEYQVMISGSSEVMDVLETLEASPCSVVQDNCAQNVDVKNISEVRNSVLVDPKHSSLSMHASGSFGMAETVTEAVGNPQMDILLASEQTKKAFSARTECVENVKQVKIAEVSHEFIDSKSTSVAVVDQCEMVVDVIHNIHNEDDSKHKELSHSIVGVSLTCEEIQELTPATGIEASLGVDQEKFAMVAGAPDAREISSHLTDISDDTHVNNSEGSSDQQSTPLEDVGTVEATPMTMLVFKSATETFGYVEEIKEADKNSINSFSGKLAFEESKETVVPDSENLSLLVALQEDSAEMKQSLLVDRLSTIQCAGVSQRETLIISSCFEISHDGSSSHNHMIATRPEARMHENKETSASKYVVSLILDEGASEVLDGIDAKHHSELEGDCNASLEENFCEATSIDLLPLTIGDPIEKHDEGIGMAAKDIEFLFLSEDVGSEMKVIEKEAVLEVLDGVDAKNHLELEGDSNTCLEERFCKVSIDPLPPTADELQEKRYENKDVACEMEVLIEKPGCLDPEEDGAASESHLQMDHQTATLLKLDGMIIDSKSGIHKVILEVVGEDASETYDGQSYDGCHEHGEQDDERVKISSIDAVLQQFIFMQAASAETVSEDFQKADCEEHLPQPKIQGCDEMAWHLNSYSSVDSVDIHDPRTHDSSYFQTDVENQIQAPSMFARKRKAVSWDDSQTCETLPRDSKNSTAACFPVDMGNTSGETEDSHSDDEKASQVKNIPVTDNVGFQLCFGGLLQQDTHEAPAEDNLKDVLGSIDADPYVKEPNLLIYNLAAGSVSEEVDTSNANTIVVSEQNQISASPCTFHEDQDCASPSLVDDLKSAEEMESHAFNGQLMDADEAAKHDFPATSDDLNKENMENSEDDVVADEDGNKNSGVLEENTLHEDVPFLLQRVCDNNNELHDAGIAASSSDIYDSCSGLTPLQNATLPSQTKYDSNMVTFCTAKEVTNDRNEEIEGKYDNNREVQNFVEGTEPTISEVNAEDGTMGHGCGDVPEIAEHSNREQDVMKKENMDMVATYGTDDIEGTQVAKGQSESTSLFNIHENFKDGENANGCQDENSMFADMMVKKERNTDITRSEGTSAESQLCEAPSSAGQLVSVSKVLLCDNWNIDSNVDVCQAVSGEHDNREIYQIENQTCVSPQKGNTLKHEVIVQAQTSNLQGHDNSSERKDLVDFEETKDCGIRDYLHLKECTNLEGHEHIEETYHETGCQVSCADMAAADIELLTSTEQEPGEQSSLNDANQTNAGFALSSPATETRQTIDTEPQLPLAEETLISIAYSPQTNCFNSLDCQASGLFSAERRSFQDTTFAEDDNEKGLGDEMEDELCSGKLKDQNDVHKLNNEISVVENTSNEAKNNSNWIEMYRMEEATCILNQSSAFQEPVCAESVDPAEESMNQENQLVSSFDCSPSKFRNHANTDDSGIDLLDEINHKLINFTISSANKFKKVQLHRTPMQLVDALRPQTRICELKNKENTSLVKIHHSINQTVEKPRRPLQSLQNNERIQQQ